MSSKVMEDCRVGFELMGREDGVVGFHGVVADAVKDLRRHECSVEES